MNHERSTQIALPEKVAASLWRRMAAMYGHKWTSCYGEKDDGTWAKGLTGLTQEQLTKGLRACLERSDAWPPTLPEFRAMCLTKPERVENAAMYRRFKALPKPKADPEQVKAQLEMMRSAVIGKG